MAFDNSGTNAVWAARLGTTPKRCGLKLYFIAIIQAIYCCKALDLRSLNMQFQQDWKKIKITAILTFCLKTEKFARMSFMVHL